MKTLVLQRSKVIWGLVLIIILGILIFFCWKYINQINVFFKSEGVLAENNPREIEVSTNNQNQKEEKTSNSSDQINSEIFNSSWEQEKVADIVPVSAVGARARNSTSEFFSQFRIERDRVRSQQVEFCREIINNPGSTAEMRKEAQQQLFNISKEIEKEMKAESLLVARGYNDAVVFLQPQSVTVVVLSSDLSKDQERQIAVLVAPVLDCKENKVTVIARG